MISAAFFDMDRTLIRPNSGTLYIKWLRARGEISRLNMLRALGWMAQYRLSVLDMESVVTRVVADLAGQSEQEMIDKCVEFFLAQVKDTVSPAARAAVEAHRRQGHLLAILSSSTPYVTEPLARHLDIEHVLCTRVTVDDGRFVGTHVRPACYGPGKVHWAEAFAARHDVDLQRSFFYTDSYSDLPMLKRVGVQRVINPDTRLKRHARRVGWTVEEW
jgi:HAD superfamily hydrolase (TIGR01490 family)